MQGSSVTVGCDISDFFLFFDVIISEMVDIQQKLLLLINTKSHTPLHLVPV